MTESITTLPKTWVVECRAGGRWTLTVALQETGICQSCGLSIFDNKKHR